MNEASSLSISFNDKPKGILPANLTLEKIIDFIRSQELDEHTTKGLIELASTYPTNAFPTFKKNINLMIQRTRAKRTQEERRLSNEQN